jgi:hypothetical protein
MSQVTAMELEMSTACTAPPAEIDQLNKPAAPFTLLQGAKYIAKAERYRERRNRFIGMKQLLPEFFLVGTVASLFINCKSAKPKKEMSCFARLCSPPVSLLNSEPA